MLNKKASHPKTESEGHRHDLTTVHLLIQKQGIPVEVEQVRCIACNEIVEEETLHRASA